MSAGDEKAPPAGGEPASAEHGALERPPADEQGAGGADGAAGATGVASDAPAAAAGDAPPAAAADDDDPADDGALGAQPGPQPTEPPPADADAGPGSNNKRPREEGADDAGGAPDKRHAAEMLSGEDQAAAPAAAEAPVDLYAQLGTGDPPPAGPTPETVTESFEVPAASVGRLIGRSGETIRALQATTGTSIQVDHSGAGAAKRVTISGLGAEAVARARAAVEALDGEEAATVTMDAPPAVVGRIIGRGGETIRALQAASEAHITLNQDFPPDHPRQVLITGRPEACERAQLMVNELMHGAPGSAQACIQRVMAAHGIGAHEAMTAPKSLLGRIIGRGGETVKAVQKATGATIQIDQSTDPCAITLAGQPAAVEAAKALISEVMNGGDPFGTSGGGPGGGWGGPGGPGGGGGGYGGGGAPGWAAGGGGGYMMAPPQGGYMMPQGWMPPQQQGWAPPGWGMAPQEGGYMMPPQAQAGWPPGGGGLGGGYPGGGGGPAAAAPAGPAGGGGGEWAEYKDDQGRSYFYNNATGVTQWERPAEGGGGGGGQ